MIKATTYLYLQKLMNRSNYVMSPKFGYFQGFIYFIEQPCSKKKKKIFFVLLFLFCLLFCFEARSPCRPGWFCGLAFALLLGKSTHICMFVLRKGIIWALPTLKEQFRPFENPLQNWVSVIETCNPSDRIWDHLGQHSRILSQNHQGLEGKRKREGAATPKMR